MLVLGDDLVVGTAKVHQGLGMTHLAKEFVPAHAIEVGAGRKGEVLAGSSGVSWAR